jgi:hypothetical protein
MTSIIKLEKVQVNRNDLGLTKTTLDMPLDKIRGWEIEAEFRAAAPYIVSSIKIKDATIVSIGLNDKQYLTDVTPEEFDRAAQHALDNKSAIIDITRGGLAKSGIRPKESNALVS